LAAAEATVLPDRGPLEPTLTADDSGCADVPLEETEHPEGLAASGGEGSMSQACWVALCGVDAALRSLRGDCPAGVQVLGVIRLMPPSSSAECVLVPGDFLLRRSWTACSALRKLVPEFSVFGSAVLRMLSFGLAEGVLPCTGI